MATFFADSSSIKSNFIIATGSISGSVSFGSRITTNGNFVGSLLGTASIANIVPTASYINANNIDGPIGLGSILSCSYAVDFGTYTQVAAYSTHTSFHNYRIFKDLGSSIKAVPLNWQPTFGGAVISGGLINNRVNLLAVYMYGWTNSDAPSGQITINGYKWFKSNNAVITTSTYNGIGLYEFDGSNLTLVASSTSDPSMWNTGSTNTWISRSFDTPYTFDSIIYYPVFYMAFKYGDSGAGGTAPAIAVNSINATGLQYSTADFNYSNKLSGYVTNTGTSLPSSIAMSSVTAVTGTRNYMLVY